MISRKTITIITSPSTSSRSLPPNSPISPSGNVAPYQYRIEERRTIYVSSTEHPPPSQSIDQLLAVPELSSQCATGEEATVRRTRSMVESHYFKSDDLPAIPQDAAKEDSPRGSNYRSRRTLHVSNPKLSFQPSSEGGKKSSPTRRRILFYHKHDPYYGFTNFSAHPVWYNNKRYPTSEHLFQSHKFQKHRPNLAEHIRTCSERPSVAFSEARRFSPEVRPDWKQVNIEKMDETLFLKFTQHADLKAELLGTGDAELVEDSNKDAFWGVGADRKGRNELGKALERLRSKLREA